MKPNILTDEAVEKIRQKESARPFDHNKFFLDFHTAVTAVKCLRECTDNMNFGSAKDQSKIAEKLMNDAMYELSKHEGELGELVREYQKMGGKVGKKEKD